MTETKTDEQLLPPVTIHMDGSDTVTLKLSDYNKLLKTISEKDAEIVSWKFEANNISNIARDKIEDLESKLKIAIKIIERFVPDSKTIQWEQRELDAKEALAKIRGESDGTP